MKPALLHCLTLSLILGCAAPAPRAAPPAPTPDPRLNLGQPNAVAREGAQGAPVDCAVPVSNRSGRALSSLVLACELLDADGVSLGVGLGALQNLPDGQTRQVRTVVYGVRTFASARVLVQSAAFQ